MANPIHSAPDLQAYDTVLTHKAGDFDSRSLISDRLPGTSREYRYRLCQRGLWRREFADPIFVLAIRRAGSVLASYGASRFAMEISAASAGGGLFGFTTVLAGHMAVCQDGHTVTAASGTGLVYRQTSALRLLTSDDSARSSVFLDAPAVERALEHQMDDRLRTPLAFQPALDWDVGLAASLRHQLAFVVQEFGRPCGLASNRTALASLEDMLTALVLQAVPHNYSGRLASNLFGIVPACLRRAEEYMKSHCTDPLRMGEIAQAAGCSVRTLNAVFRQFRDQTPSLALRAARLDQARIAIQSGDAPSVGAVAQRYGFTNPSRFTAAFRRRFGQNPADLMRARPRPGAPSAIPS